MQCECFWCGLCITNRLKYWKVGEGLAMAAHGSAVNYFGPREVFKNRGGFSTIPNPGSTCFVARPPVS